MLTKSQESTLTAARRLRHCVGVTVSGVNGVEPYEVKVIAEDYLRRNEQHGEQPRPRRGSPVLTLLSWVLGCGLGYIVGSIWGI